MSSPRRSTKFVCKHCGEKRPPTLFPRDNDTECTDCLAKLAADAENTLESPEPVAPPPKKRTPSLKITAVPPEETPQTPPPGLENASTGEVFISPGPLSGVEKEIAARTLARRRLLAFIKRFRPKYDAGWVHQDICRRLEKFVADVEAGLEPRLLLMMPVRHGKSEIASRHFAPWVLGKHPDWEIIAASGAQSLAMSFSRYIRDLVRDPAYQSVFEHMRLDPSSQSVENWNTTYGGGYLAAGIGTMITGRGAHILVIDDPVKDAEAADSQVIRDAVWEWYMSTALTRLAPGGGVLGIMCMTGDTPVLMADGSQRRLDTLKPADEIATYARGTLARTTVAAIKSSRRDSVYRILTNSGRIVRANQRHPFLTVAPNGEVSWTRLKNLTTALKIVTVKGSGANGEALRALPRGASSLPCAADFAQVTIPKNAGQMDTVQALTMPSHDATRVSNTDTASQTRTTTPCTSTRKAAARFVGSLLKRAIRLLTGSTSSPSTIVTTQEKSEDSCATTAMPESDTLLLSQWHLPPLGISDFTLERVVSVELDGVEEVFDVQVNDTENFIANGLVSHNTWWNEDDWAGRIQQVMATGDGDTFEIVKYPAINDQGDEYILPDDTIEQFPPGTTPPEGSKLTRLMNSALHPARYTFEMLKKRMANYYALGQQRWWAALYQQNPTPEDGSFFTKDMFIEYVHAPQRHGRIVYQAWDFAITENQKSDYTVGITVLVDEYDNMYVLDVWRFKTDDGIELGTAVQSYAKLWNADQIAVEDGQIWKSIKANFSKACEMAKHYPSYEVITPLTDKRTRAQPARGRMQQKKIQFPSRAPWYAEFKKELLRFQAGGKHDDQVDALAHVVRLATTHAAPKGPPKPKMPESWKTKLMKQLRGGGASHMAA
ncbi:terminase large subunit domain-containing protein [Rhodoferax fermentans]|uniref:Uncharacterized protein n=1 Tax=Rhodoferax fermentans TaxID=28066 RepID=A0A1T1AP39_RHOFE|nr:terminase family protein [Rhodoferax fermentans]OOV05775.1 hypothetical protein RF819_02785 [Rhodoferax fermentans]